MLSYIFRLVEDYENEHGMRPNVLYLNDKHFNGLRMDFADPNDIEEIVKRLEMEIVLDRTAMHPHVAQIASSHRQVAVG
jgi:hypothetical protein